MNLLEFIFKSTDVNGRPKVRVSSNGIILVDCELSADDYKIKIAADSALTITVERYGKSDANTTADHDQILEIANVTIDGVIIPEYIIQKNCKFEFNNECHAGSCWFGPNGLWTINLGFPILTWILDQKITHESQYTQDYLYPWAYQLGPTSVDSIINDLDIIQERVNRLL